MLSRTGGQPNNTTVRLTAMAVCGCEVLLRGLSEEALLHSRITIVMVTIIMMVANQMPSPVVSFSYPSNPRVGPSYLGLAN